MVFPNGFPWFDFVVRNGLRNHPRQHRFVSCFPPPQPWAPRAAGDTTRWAPWPSSAAGSSSKPRREIWAWTPRTGHGFAAAAGVCDCDPPKLGGGRKVNWAQNCVPKWWWPKWWPKWWQRWDEWGPKWVKLSTCFSDAVQRKAKRKPAIVGGAILRTPQMLAHVPRRSFF